MPNAMMHAAHRVLYALRYAIRSRAWQPAASRPRPRNSRIIVSGYFDEALGIGRAGRLIADRLDGLGYDVIREDLRPFDHGLLHKPTTDFPTEAPTWLSIANPPEIRLAFYGHRPEIWNAMYRIGAWAWESDLAPYDWTALAAYFHEIWTPSTFVAEALAKSFRTAGRENLVKRLSVHPHPVNIPSLSIAFRSDRVQVLTLFDPRSHFDRKNPMAVIEVWKTLFPAPTDKAHLTVKTLAHAVEHPRFKALEESVRGRSDISLRAETLDANQTQALIQASDIVVSLHRAEGYGLPLAEAMAAGKAVLATGWSGNMQYMTADNSWPVDYHLVPASQRYNGPLAQWAEPDLRAARKGLGLLIESEDLRRKLGARARRTMIDIHEFWRFHTEWLP